MTPSNRFGTIVATPSSNNGYRYVVKTDDGDTVYLSGPGAPQNAGVGDQGTLTYQAHRNCGFFSWNKD